MFLFYKKYTVADHIFLFPSFSGNSNIPTIMYNIVFYVNLYRDHKVFQVPLVSLVRLVLL